jgi:hypothetical protein
MGPDPDMLTYRFLQCRRLLKRLKKIVSSCFGAVEEIATLVGPY